MADSVALATKIIRVLDCAAENFYRESDSDEIIALSDKIRERYREYKRHNDFTTAAEKARVEVIAEMIEKEI